MKRPTRDIFAIDRKIINEKRKLVSLEGQSAKISRDKIRSLQLQKAEYSLQKRELQAINRLERTKARSKAPSSSGSSSGGGGSDFLAGSVSGLAGAAVSGAKVTNAVNNLQASLRKVDGVQRKITTSSGQYKDALRESSRAGQALANTNAEVASEARKIENLGDEINKNSRIAANLQGFKRKSSPETKTSSCKRR